MSERRFVFDQPHALSLTRARQVTLEPILRYLRRCGLHTALDAGCGVGYFSKFLLDLGFEVTGVDSREENVEEARNRVPGAAFELADVEDRAIRTMGPFDLVLCLGLLYHLENPFLALRNLRTITSRALIVETMVYPDRRPVLLLRDEHLDLDQSARGCALYPSSSAVGATLYRAGFPNVFRLPDPAHEDFRRTLRRRRARVMLLASDDVADELGLARVTDVPLVSDPWATSLARAERRLRSAVRWGIRASLSGRGQVGQQHDMGETRQERSMSGPRDR